jgi:hypothetical protein
MAALGIAASVVIVAIAVAAIALAFKRDPFEGEE